MHMHNDVVIQNVDNILLHKYVLLFTGRAKTNILSIGSEFDSPIIEVCNAKTDKAVVEKYASKLKLSAISLLHNGKIIAVKKEIKKLIAKKTQTDVVFTNFLNEYLNNKRNIYINYIYIYIYIAFYGL
jgi:hypothetical protein